MEEFPSNSNREKEESSTPPLPGPKARKEPKKVERIIVGEAIRRKKPLGKRLKELFIGGDAKSVWGFVAGSVLIPAAKDMVADATTQAVEQMVFGESRRGPRRGYGASPIGHNRYDGYYRGGSSSPAPWQANRPDPRREISRRGRSAHDFDEIVLESRGEAEQVIDTLFEMVSQYNSASVADLYELVGITSAYTDQKYGWTDLRGANVQHIRGGQYLLNLPRPQPLD